jgi:hypothetical protein
VGQHAFEFFIVEQLQNAMRDCDRGVARVASGGERVRRLRWDDVHFRHGNADFLGQAFHGCVSAREFFAGDGLGSIHGQCNFVGIKVGDEVHDGGKRQRQEHSILAAEIAAEEHQQQREGGQQERGLESVSHRFVLLVHWMLRRRG